MENMDSATEDIYLQKLEEFVYDEERMVTCRWLSFKLDINVKDSKQLLEKYVSDIKDSKNKNVTVTYLLSGIVEDGSLHIAIVKEDKLAQKKTTFCQVVDQQIYSIQKCKELDLNILSMVDYFDMHNPKEKPVRGSITSKRCVQRKFKTKQPLPTVPIPIVQSKSSIVEKVPSKSTTSNLAKESSNKSKQNNGITSFFSKSATTQVIVKPVSEKPSIKSEKSSTKYVASETVPEKDSTQNRSNKLIDSESDSDEVTKVSPNTPKSNENKKPKASTKRTKKKNNKAPSPKRRKRIIVQESDSDDMFGSDTKEDGNEAVMDLSEEEVPKPKQNVPLEPKNKKRKLVDRTYEDAEGYIITNKEWTEESPSEDEKIPDTPIVVEKVEEKTAPKSNIKDKKLPKSESSDFSDSKDNKTVNGKAKGGKKGKKPLAANQPTLMNFFKRV